MADGSTLSLDERRHERRLRTALARAIDFWCDEDERFADMIDRHWDGIAAYCKPENKVSLGFVEGLNSKIMVFGGPKRNMLFMCASQSLYMVQVQTQEPLPGSPTGR
jgi:hypothetical protein